MNHYDVLGIAHNATAQEIKEAYRREAMKWHPDRHEGVAAKSEAERRFKDLAVAYRVLSNPTARENYDQLLAEQLNREYQERKKQQAQQEHTETKDEQHHRGKASKQPEPEPTASNFEEQTAANDEAERVFYEQMLGLATELAGRGFPEFNIFKALIALGCPEFLAKDVAAKAAQQSKQATKEQAEFAKSAYKAPPDKAASKPSKQDQYAAIIGPKNRDFYLTKFKKFDDSGRAGYGWPSVGQFLGGCFWLFYRRMYLLGWLYLCTPFVLTLAANAIFNWDFDKDGAPKYIYNIFFVIVYLLHLPARMNAMYYIHVNKQIKIAEKESDDRNRQIAILGRVGGTSNAFVWLIFCIIAGGMLTAIALPAYEDYKIRAQVESGLLVGHEATEKVKNYISTNKTGPDNLATAGHHFEPSVNVKDLQFNNHTGVVSVALQGKFFNEKSLLLVPKTIDGELVWLCTTNGIPIKYLPSSCKTTRAEADGLLNAIEIKENSAKQARAEYDKALGVVEKKYPELNPDSSSYSPDRLKWVADRKAYYEQRGQSSVNALTLAIADYDDARRTVQRAPSARPYETPTQNGVEFFNSPGERLSMNFQNIEIAALLQIFADFSGHRLLLDTQVRESINVRFENVAWTEALTQVLQQNQLGIIKIRKDYYVFPRSYSEESAYRRYAQLTGIAQKPSNEQQSTTRLGSISQEDANRTICRTWPSACR